MTWRLPPRERTVYPRNPLEAVVIQLRFEPVLKIRERVADFQDRVRGRFPAFDEHVTQSFEVNPMLLGIRTREGREYRFRTREGDATAFLGIAALALETRAHIERDRLLADFGILHGALRDTADPITPVRLGLRYINAIDRAAISDGLGRDVAWDDVVAPELVRVPCGLADLDGTIFGAEVSSAMTRGKMILRYGLIPDDEGTPPRFRLDIDRFLDDQLDPAELADLLLAFTQDIYCVFEAAAGPALREWMTKENAHA